jgi:hypothetical protein
MKIWAQIGSIYAKKQKPTQSGRFLLFSKTIIILENNSL